MCVILERKPVPSIAKKAVILQVCAENKNHIPDATKKNHFFLAFFFVNGILI